MLVPRSLHPYRCPALGLLLLAVSASAADFTLTQNGLGPITVHTELTYEGRGERLVASATNDGGIALPLVRLCVQRTPGDCLFTLWNETLWEPGKKLEWNVTSAKHVPDLGFEVAILWMTDPRTAEPNQPRVATSGTLLSVEANPTAIIGLRSIRRIYIEKMPYDLDQYLRVEFIKQAAGKIRVVLDRADADAVLTGSNTEKTGVLSAVTGRYLGLEDNAAAAVSLVDPAGKNLLWAGEAGDRSLILGPLARGGERKVAARIVGKLLAALK